MQVNQHSDPVIDEVREIRRRISARLAHDPDRLVAYYQQLEQQFQERLLEQRNAGKQAKKNPRDSESDK
jgi:hypothetical protein